MNRLLDSVKWFGDCIQKEKSLLKCKCSKIHRKETSLMNIILHNYINLINNLIFNSLYKKIETILTRFNTFSISNYINILSSLDQEINHLVKQSLILLINELDNNYKNSLERKSKYHIKCYSPRTILTIFGEITIYRTFYKSKLNGKCFCYIDRLLGLPKYDYFDPYIKAEVVNSVADDNYSKTAQYVNSLIGNKVSLKDKTSFISRQAVRNIILNSPVSNPNYNRLKDSDTLYILGDEKWIPTQNNNNKKVMQKSIVIFDGFSVNGKRKSLNHKMTFSGRNENFIYEAIEYIEKSYNISNIKTIYILGDGAGWIDNLKYYFNINENIEIIQGLDHFHLKQCLWRIYPQKDVYQALLELIITNNKKDFIRLINEIMDTNLDRGEKIEKYKKYILSHWDSIINLYKYNLSCPMESQISHTFAAYFTSRPKGYNKEMINKLVRLRLLFKNGFNIKELYLNNLNQKEIINLGEKERDYSMFDKKDTYTVISESKRKYFRL